MLNFFRTRVKDVPNGSKVALAHDLYNGSALKGDVGVLRTKTARGKLVEASIRFDDGSTVTIPLDTELVEIRGQGHQLLSKAGKVAGAAARATPGFLGRSAVIAAKGAKLGGQALVTGARGARQGIHLAAQGAPKLNRDLGAISDFLYPPAAPTRQKVTHRAKPRHRVAATARATR